MSVGELSAGWAWATLAELCEINPKHAGTHADTLPVSFVPMAAVDEQSGAIAAAEDRPYGEVRKGYTHFAEGDVLFAKITPCMENGKAAVARGLTNGIGCGTTEFFVLRSRGAVLPEYLHRFVRQESYRRAARQTMQSGVGQARVPKDFIEHTRVPVPPLAEQRRIVAKLDELLAGSRAARAALDAVPALLERYRQAVLAAAFRGDLTAAWRAANGPVPVALTTVRSREAQRRAARSRVAELAAAVHAENIPVPDCWALAPLGSVTRLQPGFAFKSSDFRASGVRLLRGVNIEPGKARWEQVVCLEPDAAMRYEEYALAEGDIVIAMDRPFISTGLKVARIREADLPSLLLQRVGRFHRSGLLDATYLWLYLHSDIFQRHIGGQATGTQLPHISGTDIETALVPLPTVGEQQEVVRRISDALETVDRQLEIMRMMLQELDRLEQSTLAKAFRGELVPQDPANEPASALLVRLRSSPNAATRARRPRRATAPA